jgi:hypothetical protein
MVIMLRRSIIFIIARVSSLLYDIVVFEWYLKTKPRRDKVTSSESVTLPISIKSHEYHVSLDFRVMFVTILANLLCTLVG